MAEHVLAVQPTHERREDAPILQSIGSGDAGNSSKTNMLRGIVEETSQPNWKIDYQYAMIGLISLTMVLTVLDRFTTKLWLLWVDTAGPLRDDWSVSTFITLSWISGRTLLVGTSVVFWMQCRVFWNWVAENKPVWLHVDDIKETNDTIHFHTAWATIGVPLVLHVWSALWPCIFGNSLNVYSSWWRPTVCDGGTICKEVPFYDEEASQINLGQNDIYRLTTTTLCFFLFFPYSMSAFGRGRNWSGAMYLHLLAAFVYTVDMIRMYSHPHSWFFNCPFIFWYLCDRFYGVWYYRRAVATVVKKIELDGGYLILFLRTPLNEPRLVGDVFWINHLNPGFDRAHPFTCFANHTRSAPISVDASIKPDWIGHKFKVSRVELDSTTATVTSRVEVSQAMPSQATEEKSEIELLSTSPSGPNSKKERKATKQRLFKMTREDTYATVDDKETTTEDETDGEEMTVDWDCGVIIQVHTSHDTDAVNCYRQPWTQDLSKWDPRLLCGLRVWGPYRSSYRLLTTTVNVKPMVLSATGAGCAYLIDFHQWLIANQIQLLSTASVQFYFSCRSLGLFQYFTNMTCKCDFPNLTVNAHLTSREDIEYQPNADKSRDSRIGRMSFKAILTGADPTTEVFYCGAPSLQNIVKIECNKLNLKFHHGHSFHTK